MAPETAYFNRGDGLPYDEDARSRAISNGFGADELDDTIDDTFDSDELTVHLPFEQVEQQALKQDIALGLDRGDYESVGDACEEYLVYLTLAEHELESTNPKFSEVVEIWVAQEADDRAVNRDNYIAMADLYRDLHIELHSEYQGAVRAGDMSATAEWDVIDKIVSARIEENTVRDILELSRDKLALAA